MKGLFTTRIYILVVVLVITVIAGVLLGSVTPEGFTDTPTNATSTNATSTNATSTNATPSTKNEARQIRALTTEANTNEAHIEDMRTVLRDTVQKIQQLEAQSAKEDAKTSVDSRQTKHIEELREVLANTIRQLRKDDLLPGGTPCGCASKPLVDPVTGLAEETEGCRPPGWMRMMERESRRQRHRDDCPLRHYDSPSS